jgi:hypothetical protein
LARGNESDLRARRGLIDVYAMFMRRLLRSRLRVRSYLRPGSIHHPGDLAISRITSKVLVVIFSFGFFFYLLTNQLS